MPRPSRSPVIPKFDASQPSQVFRLLLMASLREKLQKSNQTQNEIAAQLGITQSRVSNLLRYRVQDFSLDMLVDLSHKLGVRVEMILSDKSPASATAKTSVDRLTAPSL